MAQGLKELRPDQARSIMIVLVGNAFISFAVQVVLVASMGERLDESSEAA